MFSFLSVCVLVCVCVVSELGVCVRVACLCSVCVGV